MEDAAILADFRARASSVYHPCGSAAMGRDPASSVVDGRLRVHGIEGLSVADASVFPAIPSANINAPAMMVAARACEFILGERGRPA
jgi:choline dehydrogenase